MPFATCDPCDHVVVIAAGDFLHCRCPKCEQALRPILREEALSRFRQLQIRYESQQCEALRKHCQVLWAESDSLREQARNLRSDSESVRRRIAQLYQENRARQKQRRK